jgi:hypothetical protein
VPTEIVEAPQFRISDHYAPLQKQLTFHTSPAKNRIQIGGFGSGKSKPLLWEGVFHCLEYPGTESIILRTKFVDLELTVINKFKSQIPHEIYDRYDEEERVVYFHRQRRRRYNEDGWVHRTKLKGCIKRVKEADCFDQRLTYTSQCEYCQEFEIVQSKLHFGACNLDKDVNKYLSTEFVYIGFEEMGEFTFTIFDALCNRNRCTYPGSRPCVAGATNPMGRGWPFIKKLFIDKKPLREMDAEHYSPDDYFYIHSTVEDNPYQFKDKEYVKKLLASPNRQKVYYGDIKTVSGNYFGEVFDPERHIQPRSAFKFLNFQSFVIGWDYGFGHYAVILWLTKAILHPQEKWGWLKPRTVNVFTRELVLREKEPKDQVDALISAIPVERDPSGEIIGFAEQVDSIHFSWERFNRTTSQYTVAQEVTDLLGTRNLPAVTSSNHVERVAGWTKMHSAFDQDELFLLAVEQGTNQGCPCLQEAIPALIRGDGVTVSMEDVVKPKGLSLNDDCGDAARYAIAGLLIEPDQKPERQKREEEIAAIKDPMARAVAAYTQYNKDREAERRPQKEVILPSWTRKIKQ